GQSRRGSLTAGAAWPRMTDDSGKRFRIWCFLSELLPPMGGDDHHRPFLGHGHVNQPLGETEKRCICRRELGIVDKDDTGSLGEGTALRIVGPFKIFKTPVGAAARLL